MTNEEKLLFAIGEIDDELIEEVSSVYKKISTPLTRGLTIAASVVAVSAVILTAGVQLLPKSFDANMSGGDACPPVSDSVNGTGKVEFNISLTGDFGRIYNVVQAEDYKTQFVLEILSEGVEKINVTIFGIGADGKQRAICTNGGAIGNYDLIVAPIFKVNGVLTDSLPTDIGIYTVIIDYSAISGTDFTWKNCIEISSIEALEK